MAEKGFSATEADGDVGGSGRPTGSVERRESRGEVGSPTRIERLYAPKGSQDLRVRTAPRLRKKDGPA